MTKLPKRGNEERTVYDHVVRLLSGHALHEGVLLDLGCGFGAVAASCAEFGLDYLGVGAGSDGLEEIARQGFSTALVDLSETTALVERLEEVLAGRQLAAITALDLIERLARPAELLTALADMANRHAGAPLVVSAANVSHFDLAAKLLSGRWDVTPAGLLDERHLSHFAPGRLEAELSRAGWKEVKADDFVVRRSDQHFPETLTALSAGTPLHDFLLEVREQSAPGALVDQFVRAYLPAAQSQLTAAQLPGSQAPGEPAPVPFLSVIVRTQGRRLVTLEDNLTSLAAQTNRDIEVVICCHDTADSDYAAVVEVMERLPRWLQDKTRAIRVDGGGRARPLQVGVEEASGRYVAFLDDDDLALCHWVEEFAKLVKLHPGAVVRAGCATHTIDEESWECGTGYCQIGSTTTLQAIAVASGYSNSAVTGGTYAISVQSGTAVSVNLSSADNVVGIAKTGSPIPAGGLDTRSYAYSATLLGTSVVWSGSTFNLGTADAYDAVSSTLVALPAGNYSTASLLATGVDGDQTNQAFVVTYTDGSSTSFTQSLSDWYEPASYAGESQAMTMAYRVTVSGATENGPFYLYGYSFAINNSKTLKSIRLPSNRDVVVLAIDVTP